MKRSKRRATRTARSESSALLEEIVLKSSLASVARCVGSSPAAVARWIAGDRVPNVRARARIASAYPDCTAEGWDHTATKARAKTPSAPSSPVVAAGIVNEVAELEHAILRLRQIGERADVDPYVSAKDRAFIWSAHAQHARALAKLRDESSFHAKRFYRSSTCARLQDAILTALSPFPDALKETANALRQLADEYGGAPS